MQRLSARGVLCTGVVRCWRGLLGSDRGWSGFVAVTAVSVVAQTIGGCRLGELIHIKDHEKQFRSILENYVSRKEKANESVTVS
jgi:hypothetical protein